MLAIRHADQRGLASIGWLHSRHTFSFGEYHDPDFMGYGSLRVINEDKVQPGQGFATHGHQNMEIISYVLHGALEHKDSLGTGSVIRPGDVQRMTAGHGVRHSEYNYSDSEIVHFLQIWILPGKLGLEPGYEQKMFSNDEKQGAFRLVASQDGREGSVTIHQDIALYATLLDESDEVSYELAGDRKCWVQVARGSVQLNDIQLAQGDGIAIEDVSAITLVGTSAAEVLLFDMAA